MAVVPEGLVKLTMAGQLVFKIGSSIISAGVHWWISSTVQAALKRVEDGVRIIWSERGKEEGGGGGVCGREEGRGGGREEGG